jgi:hypothetical protein
MSAAMAEPVPGWEYLVVRYEADAAAVAALLPAGVEPMRDGAIRFEWRRTLASSTGSARIDASVVVPCSRRGQIFGFELRHYCDQLRPARLKAGIACDGGPDFYAKLVAAPQMRMGTLHDGAELVAAAILAPDATASESGDEEARSWMELSRVTRATLGEDPPASPKRMARTLTFERRGAVTFQLRSAPSGAVVAPPVERLLDGHFFVAVPADH